MENDFFWISFESIPSPEELAFAIGFNSLLGRITIYGRVIDDKSLKDAYQAVIYDFMRQSNGGQYFESSLKAAFQNTALQSFFPKDIEIAMSICLAQLQAIPV